MKDKPIPHDTPALTEKRQSELRALLLSDKLPLPDYVCALFEGRRVTAVWFQSRNVWVFEFDSGPAIYLEPVIVNVKGRMEVRGMMAGGAVGFKGRKRKR